MAIRKQTKSNYKKHCDALFSEIIRKRDGKCMRCKKRNNVQMHCSHIVSRKHLHGRWNEKNALCKCSACHRWWHENPTRASEWLKENYPEWYEESFNIKRVHKMTLSDYKELHAALKARLKELNERN